MFEAILGVLRKREKHTKIIEFFETVENPIFHFPFLVVLGLSRGAQNRLWRAPARVGGREEATLRLTRRDSVSGPSGRPGGSLGGARISVLGPSKKTARSKIVNFYENVFFCKTFILP